MRHIRTFSRYFPGNHPRYGEPTGFVEKFWQSLYEMDESQPSDEFLCKKGLEEACRNFTGPYDFHAKHHTIRAGNRIKVGDAISFRVWSGKPYLSKQIIIAPDIQVVKTWKFEVRKHHIGTDFYIDDIARFFSLNRLAENDGLSKEDMFDWFNKPMIGQIICWNPKVEY